MRKIFFIIACLLLSFRIFPNGGITTYSSVTGVGDPVFVDMPSVNIISEKLSIELDYGYSNIQVKYILRNNSDEDYKDLQYGFPIDYMVGPRDGNSAEWDDSYLKNISFKLNGESLLYSASPETVYDEEKEIYRKWHYTLLSIPQHSVTVLEVEYSVRNGYITDGHSPLCMAGFESSGAYLVYDFSPAKHWGDGIIRDFRVEVNAIAVELSGMGTYYPVYFPNRPCASVEDYDFMERIANEKVVAGSFDLQKEGNIYSYHTRNFDLHTVKPLVISYSYNVKPESVLRQTIGPSEYKITVSGETAEYPKSNITDMNFETAWVSAKKGGIGEWMEYTFTKPTVLSGILLLNGYHKNENTYRENNRIKVLELECKFVGVEEPVTFIVDYFENREYMPVSFENLVSNAEWIDFFDVTGCDGCYEDGGMCFEKVKLTILEVYAGTKYNDTCISEILLIR